jgi:hypothetical protein
VIRVKCFEGEWEKNNFFQFYMVRLNCLLQGWRRVQISPGQTRRIQGSKVINSNSKTSRVHTRTLTNLTQDSIDNKEHNKSLDGLLLKQKRVPQNSHIRAYFSLKMALSCTKRLHTFKRTHPYKRILKPLSRGNMIILATSQVYQSIIWFQEASAVDSGSSNGVFIVLFDSSRSFLSLWIVRVRWFEEVWLEMTFFFLFLGLYADHAKNHISSSIYFFFEFNPSSLICNFYYLHWLFLIEFYFLFHTWSFDFWIWFSNLILIFELLFVLFWIIFLIDLFFYNFIPRHLFSFNFCVKLVQLLLIVIF